MATLVRNAGHAENDRPGAEYDLGICSIGDIVVFVEAIFGTTSNTDMPSLVTDIGHSAAGTLIDSDSGTWQSGTSKYQWGYYEVTSDADVVLLADAADTNAPSAWVAAIWTPDAGETFLMGTPVVTEDSDSSTSTWTNVAATAGSAASGFWVFGMVYFHCTTNWSAGDISIDCSPHGLDFQNFDGTVAGEELMGAYEPFEGESGTVTWTATDSVPGASETVVSFGVNFPVEFRVADDGVNDNRYTRRKFHAQALPYDVRNIKLLGGMRGRG